MNQHVGHMQIGFMGVGNMSQAIIRALLDSGHIKKDQLFATNRSVGKLQKVTEEFGIQGIANNEELLEKCDVVILAMKPQDLIAAIEPISSSFEASHTVISLAAGVSLGQIQKVIYKTKRLVRVMPNTPVRICQGVVGYCMSSQADGLGSLIEGLFAPLGLVVRVDEGEEFEALTVSCSSGIGFVFELMQYWQEWLEEHDFHPEVAKAMTVKTFLGASQLADQSANSVSFQDLQDNVTSKKGVTAAGLHSMRELEIERLLRYSFEKAVLRDRELGQG